MDLFRFLMVFCFLFFFSTVNAHSTSQSNFGIVFIHGTNDHREDADGSYWKKDFTRSLANALPNPDNFFIVHCDFSYYMWHEEAAGCVANQMLKFLKDKNINSITVYTHSNGSNVLRWILSNPTYDARYMQLKPFIKEVIAISPSSGGTPLADEVLSGNIFVSGIGWLLGYHNDSVRQQRVGDMKIFNDHLLFGTKNRPSLPVPFRTIIGTDVTASPFSSASYCNGYLLNTALKITKIYLDKCSDGFLNCTSQREAGELWFNDIEKTEEQTPLSHNQSRHSCFGLGQILINELRDQGVSS